MVEDSGQGNELKKMFLLDLAHVYFEKLSRALDHQQQWTKVLNLFQEDNLLQNFYVSSYDKSPGMKLLIELTHLNITIDQFVSVLNECELDDVLSVICTEPMAIKKQLDNSSDIYVARGNEFILEYEVFGLPVPKYKWYRNESILPEQNNSRLHYKHFSPKLKGRYYCTATQYNENEIETLYSNTVSVYMSPEPCMVLKKPLPQLHATEGESVSIEIEVTGYPLPKYEWTSDNTILKNVTSNKLNILRCRIEDSGTYRCRIYNHVSEVIVGTNLLIQFSNYLYPIIKEKPVEKIALLIGNAEYQNLISLKTPINDVNSLTPLLQSMNFLVIKKNNLNLENMKQILELICNIIVPESYVIFYFGGHGFTFAEKYLIPVDAPDDINYQRKDCINESAILKQVLRKKPKLFLNILDMCLAIPNSSINKKIYEEINPEMFDYEPDTNIIQAYSTGNRLNSYELGEANTSYNSIYNTVLKKHLIKDKPILKIMADVHLEVKKITEVYTIKQIPQISYNVVNDFYINT